MISENQFFTSFFCSSVYGVGAVYPPHRVSFTTYTHHKCCQNEHVNTYLQQFLFNSQIAINGASPTVRVMCRSSVFQTHPSRRQLPPLFCWWRRCRWSCPVRSVRCQAWRCALAAPYGGTHSQAPCALSCLSIGQSSCKSHTRLKSRQMVIQRVMLKITPNKWIQQKTLQRGCGYSGHIL